MIDENYFRSLKGIELGHYVDEVERSRAIFESQNTVSDLLANLNDLPFDHCLYVIRWSLWLNLDGAFDKVMSVMLDSQTPPSARLSIVRMMRRLPFISDEERLRLLEVDHQIPTNIWLEAVDKIPVQTKQV